MQEHPGLKLGIGQKVKQDGRNLGVSGRKMREKNGGSFVWGRMT